MTTYDELGRLATTYDEQATYRAIQFLAKIGKRLVDLHELDVLYRRQMSGGLTDSQSQRMLELADSFWPKPTEDGGS